MATPLFSPAVPLPTLRLVDAGELPLLVEPLALLMPLQGDAIVTTADERFRLRSGELLVLRSGDAVRIERTAASACVAWFQADPRWVDEFRALLGDAETRERGRVELLPAGTTLAHRAEQLFVALRLDRAPGDARVPAVTIAALLEIARDAQGSPLDPRRSRRAGTRREALVEAIASYDPEASGEFSLSGLAERFGLSERQTARLLRSATGRSFRELKASARLERAQKLLASSELPILEVALRAGWNSASQFHEAFRSSVGVSPARYRAAHRA